MGSSCTFPRPKRKITRNEHGTNNEEFDETNQPLVENQQNQQQRNEPKIFTYAQMVAATNEFDDDNILGEGGFGRVYKGNLEENDQVVAVKKMERQGREEFNIEVGTLSAADHPNMVKLIGYCSEGWERLLVYEYMPLGSLSDLLHGVRANSVRLDWNARMKIAAGTAGGLAYLHYEMDPPIIYRDLKSSNILLDEGFNVKLSDFGLARVGPTEDESHVSTRVMGTYGYCAPEYAMTGQLTFKSDMYSLGVVLLELMTGRKAIDDTKPASEQNLVVWARPMLSNRKLFFKMVDPKLNGEYPIRGLEQALALVALCLQTRQNLRPSAADVCAALNCLATEHYGPQNQQV